MENINAVADQAHQVFEARTRARDQALLQARQLTRHAANAIRAIHRTEIDLANEHLAQARLLVESLTDNLIHQFPDLFYAGYTQDAIKEFAEASITCALIQDLPLPMPEELGLENRYATYLNGLAEVVGELRRRCLDILRQGYSQEAERLLTCMDEIYTLLVTMDYPDAITNGLRRQTDLARGIVERTRGDLTISLREEQLKINLEKFMERLDRQGSNDADHPGV
ncbi:MAG: haloacid dehalogenase [Chloroflexi bacterium]|nr:haloacid dehalogenase [Anaerolineaceae bacterium]NMB90507.1 haloacid dehalogenase [Chloroflexota bacterium]